MEKQIEEMAKDLCECYVDYGTDTIDVKATAEKLTAKGYRKASDVAREIFAEIFNFLENQQVVTENARLKEVAEWIFHDYLPRKFAELKKKYESEE